MADPLQIPYDNGYSYRKKITVDSSKVGSGTHTNFTAFITTTDNDLKGVLNGGKVLNAPARDIIFTDNNHNTVSFEVTRYDSATGALDAWVQIPSLSSSAGAELYIYYGKELASDPSDTTNLFPTWDGVIHMRDNMSSTKGASFGSGDVGGATVDNSSPTNSGYNFDGTNDYINLSSYAKWQRPFAWSFWIRPETRSHYGIVFATDNMNSPYAGAHLRYNIDGTLQTQTGNNTGGGPSSRNSYTTTAALALNAWYKVDVQFTAHNNVTIYVNGVAQSGSYSGTASTIVYTSQPTRIGTNHVSGQYFDGKIAELRVKNEALHSAGWILTEYNNQSSPSTFYSVGDEEVYTHYDGSFFAFF